MLEAVTAQSEETLGAYNGAIAAFGRTVETQVSSSNRGLGSWISFSWVNPSPTRHFPDPIALQPADDDADVDGWLTLAQVAREEWMEENPA